VSVGARSAREAVEMAVAYRPDLVIMDIRLESDSDGIDAAIEILRRTGTRCLFATANSDEHTRVRAGAATPHGWLEKPYLINDMIAAVQTIVGRR
jgi:two-component system, response regulator PdtaR